VNDVTINKFPKFLAVDPIDQTHSKTIRDNDELTQTCTFRQALQGLILLLYIITPSHDDWNCGEFRRLALTSETMTWDPTNPPYEEKENANIACIVFRPSWDHELGLALLLNLDTMEVELYQD
jgi:hypothetical protein